MKSKGPKKKGHEERREQQGLSLQKFASARQSGAQKLKKKAYDHNAKTMREYKTLLKKLKPVEDSAIVEGEAPRVDGENTETEKPRNNSARSKKGRRGEDPVVTAERKNEAKREEIRKMKDKALEEQNKRRKNAKLAAAARQKDRSRFRRTNSRGQPIMKYQIEEIVRQLDAERSMK